MSTITVSNQSQLMSALASAKGGDEIVLKDGHYGSVRLSNSFASEVTIRSEKPLGATISNLEVFGAKNLTFDGINFASGGNGANGRGIVSIERGASGITIANSEVHGSADGQYQGHYGIYVRGSDAVSVRDNSIHDVDCGIVTFGSKGSSYSGNRIDYVGHDAMKFAGLVDSEIVENVHGGHHFPQPSNVHTDFIQFQGDSANVRIDGNVFLAGTLASVQGIFVADGVYSNFVVENNIIYTGMLRGISISNGSGMVIRNNTLLNVPGEIHPSTTILVPAGSIVENNIMGTKGAGGLSGSNLILQNSRPDQPFYVEDYFLNGAEGRGLTIDDLRPIAGSLGASKGAIARLLELLDEPGTVPPKPTDPTSELAVNAGGGAYGDFAADAGATGGQLYGTGAAIAGTTADAVYQTERYGDFGYDFALGNGTYQVTLKFAEIYWDAAGQRLFDVRAEGRTVLDDLDIFKLAGGKNIAWDRTITVEVKDGRLDLDFVSVRDFAKVGGIVVAPLKTPAISVDAGGAAEVGFTGGTRYSTAAAIARTDADGLYQTERYGTFKYSAAVADGTYDVTLKFAEIYWDKAGQRAFDVRAEGKLVLDDLDVFRMAGGKNTAWDKVIEVEVTDGRLDLDFITGRDNATIAGIEIAPHELML